MTRRRVDKWSFFVASMFIGLGIGMIFDQSGAGIITGMGVGFLIVGLLPGDSKYESTGRKEAGETIYRRYGIAGSLVLLLIGLGFILWGMYMLELIYLPTWLIRYFGAFIILFLGLVFLLWGLSRMRTESKQRIQ